jgi:hypothetical protein
VVDVTAEVDVALWPRALVEIPVNAAQHSHGRACLARPAGRSLHANTPRQRQVRLDGDRCQWLTGQRAVGREGVGQAVRRLSQQRVVLALRAMVCSLASEESGWDREAAHRDQRRTAERGGRHGRRASFASGRGS